MGQIVGSPVTGQGDGGGGSIATSAKATTSGNCLSAEVKWEETSATLTSVTDTAGNTYVIVSQGVHGNGSLRTAIAYAKNITGNASNVVTANFSDANPTWRRIIVKEWSELDTNDPLDDSDSSSGSGTSYSTPSLTTTKSGVVVGGVGAFTSLSGITAAGTPTFTHSGTVADTFSVHLISDSAQTVTPGASSSTSSEWIMRAIALKDAAAAVPNYNVSRPWIDDVIAASGISNTELRNAAAWF